LQQRTGELTGAMAQLAFMVGTWECVSSVSMPGQPPARHTLVAEIRPILGGAWIEWDARQQAEPGVPGNLNARYTIGWNEATAKFVAFYYDNGGSYGHGTSAGMRDDRISFAATMVTRGAPFEVVDDFIPSGPDDFVYDYLVRAGEEWTPALTTRCHRL
jgi:hypothetical protein